MSSGNEQWPTVATHGLIVILVMETMDYNGYDYDQPPVPGFDSTLGCLN